MPKEKELEGYEWIKKWMVVLMTGVTLMGNVIGMGTTVIASKK